MYLERETSGATLAENCCTKNKKPLTEQGLMYLERETRFELATCTLARYRSTN